ncbi:MAG: hypothetical protein ACOY3M_01695 [Patescibacteria group bacterium]
MSNTHLPLPCQRLQQIDASVCNRKEGCGFPLGQTGCFTRLLAEHRGALGRLLPTGYRAWDEGSNGKKRVLIASPLFHEPLPDCAEADDLSLAIAGTKAVNNAARSIRTLLHTHGSNGRNGGGAEDVEGDEDRPERARTFYGVSVMEVEDDARRKVGKEMLGE